FDCYACHHGIRSKSWRQERGYTGVPGRVPMRSWSTELIHLAIEHFCLVDPTQDCAALKAQLAAGLKALQDAVNARAFRAPAPIHRAALGMYVWSDNLARRINAVYPNSRTS